MQEERCSKRTMISTRCSAKKFAKTSSEINSDYFLKNSIELNSKAVKELIPQIIQTFPTEIASDYHCSKNGALVTKYGNDTRSQNKIFRDCGAPTKKRKIESITLSDDLKQKMHALKHDLQPDVDQEKYLQCWSQTAEYRCNEIRKLVQDSMKDRKIINQIDLKWPEYKEPIAAKLVNILEPLRVLQIF